MATHIFDAASDYLDSDAVFAVKPSLARSFVEHEADDPERPHGVDGDWVSLEPELVLAPDAEAGEVVDPGRTGPDERELSEVRRKRMQRRVCLDDLFVEALEPDIAVSQLLRVNRSGQRVCIR